MGLKDLLASALGSNTQEAVRERELLKEQLAEQLEGLERGMVGGARRPTPGTCPKCTQPIGPQATYCRFCGWERPPAAEPASDPEAGE
jgi:hypothetical protein